MRTEEKWLIKPIKLESMERQELINILTRRCGEKTHRRVTSILTYNFETVRETGLLDRFYVNESGLHYCAGQSYPCEIRRIRQEILKRWP